MTDRLLPRTRVTVAPGAVHVPDWLDPPAQRDLLADVRGWARGPVPMHAPTVRSGAQMSVRLLCLGWHWLPYRYTRTAEDVNGAQVLPLPEQLVALGRAAVLAAYDDPDAAAAYTPDTALINHYDDTARMGMHQDRDERCDAPVVSLSLGDTCTFRFGNTEHRNRPWTDVELVSGDLFVFGGPSRFAYHGVPRTRPGTGDPAIGWRSGRINLTLRMTGLE